MIPILFALTFSILLTLVFFISGLFLFARWTSIFVTEVFNTSDMKVPTFYSTEHDRSDVLGAAYVFLMSVVGVVFGGIHCVGWFFDFPSSDEAILWRVSSAVLTGTAFLLPLLLFLLGRISNNDHLDQFTAAFLAIILLVYVVSRLILLVEAFISLRHLTPGMLALVKWTSFVPHI